MSNIAWNNIEWANVRSRVDRYQRRIYKASLNNDQSKVRFLQKQLISSLDAKLYAVLRVTTWNKGKNTPGVDEITLFQPLREDIIMFPISSYYTWSVTSQKLDRTIIYLKTFF